MNYIDYAIIAVVGFFVVKGLFRGFISEVFGFVGLIVSLIIATKYMSNIADFLNGLFDMPSTLSTALGFILVFVSLMISFQILSHLLQKAFQKSPLNWLEKLAGGTVGFLKGATIMSLLLMMLLILPFGETIIPGQNNSVLAGPTRRFAPRLFNLLMEISPNSKTFYDEIFESVGTFSSGKVGKRTKEFLDSLQQDEDADKK